MIRLEREMIYRVRPRGPLGRTDGAPEGVREYWELSEAELRGPRIDAKSHGAGSDWFRVSTHRDELSRPDVRVQFLTTDGALVLLHYTGLVRATEAFVRAADTQGSTAFEDQYMRMQLTFATGAESYRWLYESLWLAAGRLDSGWIEYVVYRVT
jgi:hypothetical protein